MKSLFFLILVLIIASSIYWLKRVDLSSQPDSNLSPAVFSDGKYLGFIHAVEVGEDNILFFDEAIWLTGQKAEDAAIAAGHCTEENRSECLPNDYFIQNSQKLDQALAMDSNMVIFMKTWNAGEQGVLDKEINLLDFSKLINDPSLHWSKLPYNVFITNEQVVRVEEVYIP